MLKKCMGKGYRAELDYADIGDVSLPLFDPEKLAECTNIQLTGTYDESIVEGSTIKDYSSKLSASVGVSGSAGMFSASVSTSFNSEAYESSENSFYTLKKVYHYYRLDLDMERATLLPQVKADIDNMPPNQLFDKYGTHYVKSAFIGARVVLNTYINKSEYSNATNFSASLKASYGAVSGDASVSTDTEESTRKFSSNSSLQIYGGDPLLSGNILNGLGNKKQNYDAWVASTKVVDGHTLADFGNQGLQAISDLASTPARQADLKKALNEYLESKGTPLPVPKTLVKKNSVFGLQSADSRWVSIPLFKGFVGGAVYYPLVVGTENVAGFFTFEPSSSEKIMHGANVTIRFVADKLYPHWNEGKTEVEQNQDWLKKNFLKVGGGIIPHAHYWDNSSDCNWVIQKVDGRDGDPIFDGDQVYIYHSNQKKYLTMYSVGGTALGVQELKDADKGSDDKEFKWKIRLVKFNAAAGIASN